MSLPSFSSTTFINGGVVQTFQTSGTDVRRLSAFASEFTAGVTIPINFQRSPYTAFAAAVPVPAAVPVVPRWDGLYASFSAGGAWTRAKSAEARNTTDVSDGVTDDFFTLTDNLSGKDIGAVFTFGMGYNVLWGRWLAGIQSEVSYNKTLIDAKGTSSSVDNNIFFGTSIQTFDVRADVERKWTISEMARLGYLVAPDWLVYGLVGWSWSGFDFRADFNRIQDLPYALNGITWGAGVEKDFGWLRAFIQYKGIDFGSKSVNLPVAFSAIRGQRRRRLLCSNDRERRSQAVGHRSGNHRRRDDPDQFPSVADKGASARLVLLTTSRTTGFERSSRDALLGGPLMGSGFRSPFCWDAGDRPTDAICLS